MRLSIVLRPVLTVCLACVVVGGTAAPAAAQTHTWNGPFTGTTAWSAGTWAGGVPPVGGASGTTLVFNQLGSGTYTAENDRGTFQFSTLVFNSTGGGVTVANAAGNTLEIVGTGSIQQNGLGVQTLSAATTLTATNTTISGTGPGNLAISGVLSGAGALTINRPQNQSYTGLTDLTGANTFAGGVTLQAGNLRVGNASALGTGTLTVQGGTLGATTATTLGNAVNLQADLVYSGFAGLTLTGPISETGGARRVVVSTVNGAILTLQGTNTYSGATVIEVNPRTAQNEPAVGGLIFSGANGSALNSPSFSVAAGGILGLDNSLTGGNNNNRIADTAPVTVSGGAFFLTGGNGVTTQEVIGALSGEGTVIVEVDAGTTGNLGTTLQASSLARINRGQFVFRGNNASFGGAPGANVANLLFTTAPTLVGGGGGAGSTTISIIPYAIGGTAPDSFGTDLVTYGANGVRPLAAGEYATTIASGTATADNVRLTTPQAITADTTINALVLATNTPFTGSTARLTVTSGTVVVPDTLPVVPVGMTLDFGAAEGNVFLPWTVDYPRMTVDGVLAGTNGLTVGGDGALRLTNPGNTITGTLTLNQGYVEFPDTAALASFTNIRVNGAAGTFSFVPALELTATTGTFTLNKAIEVTGGFVQLGSAGAALTVAGQITGAGGVFIFGGDIELTNTSNSYSGQTRVYDGNLLVGSDAVLGNGGGVDFGALATSGLRLTGNWTTARQINFSFSSQVDTNGFNWTVNSGITGNGATINKVGAGIWELTQGGTLGQSLTSGNGTTVTTLNVNGGELRVTNPTGSATGTATVNVGSATLAATLSGTGRIAGATTVGEAATVSPGTGGNAGTLTLGSTLTLNGTFRVDAAGDRIDAAGAVTLGTASVLNLTGATFDPQTYYVLLTGAALTGTFATVTSLPVSHLVIYAPTGVVLAPVPEPGAVLLLAAGVLGAGAAARRRAARRGAGAPAA